MRTDYTAQIDLHGNIIVCRGNIERKGYQVFYWGTYNDCLIRKATYTVPPHERPSRRNTRPNGQPLDTEE
jgi:hypothetical protein